MTDSLRAQLRLCAHLGIRDARARLALVANGTCPHDLDGRDAPDFDALCASLSRSVDLDYDDLGRGVEAYRTAWEREFQEYGQRLDDVVDGVYR